jgi:phage-related protein
MTQPGRASIEIVGDVSKLGRQLKRDAQQAVDNIDLDTTELANEIGDGFKQGAAEGVEAFQEAEVDIDAIFEKIKSGARDAAEEVVLHFEEGGVRIVKTFKDGHKEADGLFDGIADGARESGESIRRNLITPITNGFSRIGDLLGSAGSAVAGLVITGINPAGLATLALYAVAFTALIPLVIGLGAALSSLAGVLTVLPAAITGAAGALIVGTIAFQGFGDALGAIMDGDPEKIAEALKELAPAAREVAREFQEVLPAFRRVGDLIQQRFFEPLVGQLETFGKRTLPLVRDELGDLSTSLGRILGNIGDIVNETKNAEILGRLLDSTTVVTDKLGAAFSDLGRSLFEALDASLPMLEELGAGLADAISGFADWLSGSVKDGSFQEFWDSALDTLGRVWNLVKAVGDLLGTLFAGTEEGGKDFIDTLTDLTKRLTEFFKSAEGQEALQDFEEIIGAVGVILGYVINVTREFIDIFTELDDAVEAVGQFFSDLWDDIVEIWDGITETVGGAIDSIVAWFEALPDRIVEFVQSIPERIAAFFTMLGDQALTALSYFIAAVIVFFTDLPEQIALGLAALWEKVTEWFGRTKDSVIEIFNNVLTFFEELPGKIGEFLASLPGKIADFFTKAKDGVVNQLTEMVNFVKGIPGKILSALGAVGTMLFESGKKIVQGLINGISEKIGALKAKVAEAVQNIRDYLPFSPAKTGPLSGGGSPDVAGAKIAAMIAAGLDSGLPLLSGAANRAAGAVAEAGVPPLATSTPGGPQSVMSPTSVNVDTQPIFLVRIGDEDIEAYVEKIVDQRVQVEVRRLMAGTRGI